MLKLQTTPTFKWPIRAKVPVDGGKYEESTFDLVFKRLSRSEFETWLQRVDRGEINPAAGLAEIIVGWDGVVDSDGQEVPFSQDKLREVLEVVPFPAIIMLHLQDAMAGAARRKN